MDYLEASYNQIVVQIRIKPNENLNFPKDRKYHNIRVRYYCNEHAVAI